MEKERSRQPKKKVREKTTEYSLGAKSVKKSKRAKSPEGTTKKKKSTTTSSPTTKRKARPAQKSKIIKASNKASRPSSKKGPSKIKSETQARNRKKSSPTSNKSAIPKRAVRPTAKPITKKSKIIGTIWNIIFFAVIFMMLSGSALFAVSNQQDKSFFGYRIYNVLTNSMKKTKEGQKGNFVAGDMIVVKIAPASSVKVNDIITFVPGKNANAYLTHRVVEKKEIEKAGSTDDEKQLQFVTRGDANSSNDPPITGDLVIGKVMFALPFMGTAMTYIRENVVPVLIFVAAFFLLILVLQQYFTSKKEEIA